MDEIKKLDLSKPIPGQGEVWEDVPMFEKIIKSMKDSEPINHREPQLDLHEVGLFINTLNAREGAARHQGEVELEAMLRKAQEIIFELLGELEGR